MSCRLVDGSGRAVENKVRRAIAGDPGSEHRFPFDRSVREALETWQTPPENAVTEGKADPPNLRSCLQQLPGKGWKERAMRPLKEQKATSHGRQC